MFEQELELEKKEGSSFGPLIIILLLVAMLVGGIAWVVYQTRKTLKPAEASAVISTILANQGPSYVKFHTGHITPDVNEKLEDPQYRLMVKAGIVKMTKPKGGVSDVTFTPDGEKLIASIPGVEKTAGSGGTSIYKIPLATRSLVGIAGIDKLSPTRFRVTYTWKWNPNPMGEDFNAEGSFVKGFNTWDRSTLIDKYGVAFYHGTPTKVMVTLQEETAGWKVVTE